MTDAAQVTAHITANTAILPAITAYDLYLKDQGRSHYTIKAFISDLRLMATHFPADCSVGEVNTDHLNEYFKWMLKSVRFLAAPRPWRVVSQPPNLFFAGCTKMESCCWIRPKRLYSAR